MDTINKESLSRMNYHCQWQYFEAPKRGLRDPWLNRPDGLLDVEEIMTKLAGTDKEVKAYKSTYRLATDKEMAAWKAERDEYMRQRDEWIALKMFHRYGYETFLEECEACHLTEEFRKSVFPCESKCEAQCSFLCPIYNDCALRIGGE